MNNLNNGMGAEGFSLTSMLTDPDAVMKKYTEIALKQGTRALLLQVAAFSLITWFIVDSVNRKYR